MDQESNEIDDSDCRSLWLSVIMQGLIDARCQSRKPSARKERVEAREWLKSATEDSDFQEICNLAGVEPDDVRRVFKEIDTGNRALDFRVLRKFRAKSLKPRGATVKKGEKS